MRQYQPIWEALKRTGVCTIRCHPEATARIKKAVIKEKYSDRDVAWRGRRILVSIARNEDGTRVSVTFKLVVKLTAISIG